MHRQAQLGADLIAEVFDNAQRVIDAINAHTWGYMDTERVYYNMLNEGYTLTEANLIKVYLDYMVTQANQVI
ncbi:MAG: hypothetical protein R3321_00105 [Nitrososphaeraceae archaeon]|nr:hypothetical protein [Nitrososphaeraceae archaeon]